MKSKSYKTSSLFLLILSIFLVSCSSTMRLNGNILASRDASKKSFVEKKDGTIIEANQAVLRAPLFKKSTIELDNNVKIPTKEIEAFQDNEGYYRRVEGSFAPRIKKGLINMYRSTETYQEFNSNMGQGNAGSWRTRTRVIYHLQKGDSASVVRFTPAVTKQYVQDYAPAMEFINVYEVNRKKSKTWALINTTATIGGLVLLGTAGVKNDNVTTAGYAGVGLFLGGLANGFVNKIRKAKNYKNLELAIDEYNGQVVKTKRKK